MASRKERRQQPKRSGVVTFVFSDGPSRISYDPTSQTISISGYCDENISNIEWRSPIEAMKYAMRAVSGVNISGDMARLMIGSKKPGSSDGDPLFRILLVPSGSGKSTLAKKHPDMFKDIDDLVTPEIDVILKESLRRSLITDDWITHNAIWRRLTTEFLATHGCKYVYLAHGVSQFAVNAIFVEVKVRWDLLVPGLLARTADDALKIGRSNWDSLKNATELKSFAALERVATIFYQTSNWAALPVLPMSVTFHHPGNYPYELEAARAPDAHDGSK